VPWERGKRGLEKRGAKGRKAKKTTCPLFLIAKYGKNSGKKRREGDCTSEVSLCRVSRRPNGKEKEKVVSDQKGIWEKGKDSDRSVSFQWGKKIKKRKSHKKGGGKKKMTEYPGQKRKGTNKEKKGTGWSN